jgi:hypothetical protein
MITSGIGLSRRGATFFPQRSPEIRPLVMQEPDRVAGHSITATLRSRISAPIPGPTGPR